MDVFFYFPWCPHLEYAIILASYEEVLNMNEILKFSDFLKKTHYHLTRTGKIRRNTLDETRLTDNSITIIQIDVDSFDDRHINFDVTYEISVPNLHGSIIVTRMSNGQINSEEWENLFNDIDFLTKKKEDIAEIKSLFKHYFKKAITLYLKNNPAATHFTGWFRHMDGFTYFPLGEFPANANVLKTSQIFFNHYLNRREFHSSLDECCKQTNNFQPFFDFVLSDKNIFTVFAYGLHSVLFDYLSQYQPLEFANISNTDTALFSLCMYGDNINNIKILANILLNFFEIGANNWKTIKRDVHLSASSLSTKNYDKLRSYMSVPILVDSNKTHLTKASSIIKKIHHLRECGKLHIFPTYINQSPICADEIINCNLGNINNFNFHSKEQLHFQYCLLMYHFISYLSTLSPHERERRAAHEYITLSLYKVVDEFALSSDWLENNLPYYLLFIALDCFYYFLCQNNMSDIAQQIRFYAKDTFIQQDCSIESVNSAQEPSTSQQTDILKLFAAFLSHHCKSSTKNEWLFSGTEKRGNKEECYYLRQKDGFKKFQEYLIQKKLPPINQRNFDKMLRDHGLLKLPTSGKSNTLCRGNKEYYYVLYKDKVSLFLNENFQK